MFIPKLFEVTDFEEIRGFVEENAFGSIVTVHEGRPVATHLPFQFRRIGEEWMVTGHFAKVNPQWETIEGQEALVMVRARMPMFRHRGIPMKMCPPGTTRQSIFMAGHS